MIVFIYALQDPITLQIRYIGKTKNLNERFKNHLNRGHNKHSHKRAWIDSLKKQGLKPIMLVIDEVSESEWQKWEKYWISQFRAWGFNLVNHTAGGDGSTMGNSGSFKKGQIGWNKGTLVLHDYICQYCEKSFKSRHHNKKFCSKKCTSLSRKGKPNVWSQGRVPWNKDLKGYVTGRAYKVEQYDLEGNLLHVFENIKEVSLLFNCTRGAIEACCRGTSKTSKGFIWRYVKNKTN